MADTGHPDYYIVADKVKLIEVIQYGFSLVKENKRPVILHEYEGSLFSYLCSNRHEIRDNICVEKMKLPEGLFLGIEPRHLLDMLNVLDSEKMTLR